MRVRGIARPPLAGDGLQALEVPAPIASQIERVLAARLAEQNALRHRDDDLRQK